MADFCTLADVKTWLNIDDTNTNSDELLTSLITSGSAYIENWTNRSFSVTSTTYRVNGNGSSVMLVKDYPINSVTSVTVSGIAYTASNGTSTGFMFDENTIYLIGAKFTKEIQNVSIVFNYGYATIPAELKQVVVELVGYKFKETERIGLLSKVLAGETIAYDIRDLKDHSKNILNNYNRVVPL